MQQKCNVCGHSVSNKRGKLGYRVCLPCGEEIAFLRRFTIACNNKQGYELITDLNDLKTLNPKRTL